MDIQSHIPPLLIGEELVNALTVLPKYDPEIRKASASARLLELNKLYDIYIPSVMTAEIYSKLYLAFVRSIKKKQTIAATKQAYENRKAVRGQPYRGIMGGSDSFTIIGVSGIGKSSAIHRSVELISQSSFWAERDSNIAPFLTVQTPGDASLKGLLMEIIRTIDALFDTKYYADAIRSMTNDFLEYYNGMNLLGFEQGWQIEKIFNNQRINPFEICSLGMFLNIPPEELVKRNDAEDINIVESFDRQVIKLKSQGWNYREIAEYVGMSYDYVKSIGNGSRGRYSYPHKQGIKKQPLINWTALDAEILPKLKQLISEVTVLGDNRPIKISHGYIERTLCLKEGQLAKLPRSKVFF